MMTLRQLAVLALVGVTMTGCRKKQPEEVPAPATDTTMVFEDTDQARRDSIARAERAREEAAARDRAEAIARAREAITDVVYFEYDSEQLTVDAEQRLQTKISILRANPTLRIRIEGHADERGSTEYNLALGQRRAETVKNYLQTYGIEGTRIETLSWGEERPASMGSNESAWARNRRAEFEISGGDITTVPQGVRP